MIDDYCACKELAYDPTLLNKATIDSQVECERIENIKLNLWAQITKDEDALIRILNRIIVK